LIKSYCINGEGINNEDLICAGIKDASVVFAANGEDFKNLSTLITAKEINNDIYTIAIQNKSYRNELFDKIKIDLILQPQHKIAAKVHSLISEPYLNDFYKEIENLDNDVVQRIEYKLSEDDLQTWHFRLNNEKSFFNNIKESKVKIKDLIPFGHKIIPLMISKECGEKIVDPKLSTIIQENDVVLFTGNNESFCRQRLMMYNINVYEEYQIRKQKKVK